MDAFVGSVTLAAKVLDGLAVYRYEGMNVEYGSCGNQVLRHISCQQWQYGVNIRSKNRWGLLWWVRGGTVEAAREKEMETFVRVLIMRVSSSGQGKRC